jgi:putative protease
MNKVELLAPAGSLEKLYVAIDYGADAVYIGGQEFGLRANADNFSIEEIKTACEYAHDRNAKVYVTVNIIFHDENFEGLDEYLVALENAGVDALIVADLYAITKCQEVIPNMEIHLSTQQSVINHRAVNFFHQKGVHRVVLAREANKGEIKELVEKSNAEIEVFIHGGVCISYSGRCTLSNHMTARDSNRGGCSQNCRWEFDLFNQEKNISAENVMFSMNPKDLMQVEHIVDMIKDGVVSLKVEGRMRSVHYIATVISTYRKLIDDYYRLGDDFVYSNYYENELQKSANRVLASQYYTGMPSNKELQYDSRAEHPTQEFIGIIKEVNGTDVTLEQRNFFRPGDLVEVFGPEITTTEFIMGEIFDIDGNSLDAARHPKQIIKTKIDVELYPKNMLRKVRK